MGISIGPQGLLYEALIDPQGLSYEGTNRYPRGTLCSTHSPQGLFCRCPYLIGLDGLRVPYIIGLEDL